MSRIHVALGSNLVSLGFAETAYTLLCCGMMWWPPCRKRVQAEADELMEYYGNEHATPRHE